MQADLKQVDGATAVTSTKTMKVVQVPQTLGLVETCPCMARANPILFPSLKRLVPHSVACFKWDLTHCKESRGRAKFL